MSFTVTGQIVTIMDERSITDKMSVREFVVELTDGKYPQMVKFQAINRGCEVLSRFSPGDTVDVSFNLKGRKWKSPKTGKEDVFNALEAWRVHLSGEDSVVRDSPEGGSDYAGNPDLPF